MNAAEEFPELWTTRDGRKIKVGDMDEHHVRAALNMAIRRARKREALQTVLEKIEAYLAMPQELRDQMSKHDIGLDDDWPELNTSEASIRGASR